MSYIVVGYDRHAHADADHSLGFLCQGTEAGDYPDKIFFPTLVEAQVQQEDLTHRFGRIISYHILQVKLV